MRTTRSNPPRERPDPTADALLEPAPRDALGLRGGSQAVVELWVAKDRVEVAVALWLVILQVRELGLEPSPFDLPRDFALIRLPIRGERGRQLDRTDGGHDLVEVRLGE